MFTFDLTKIFLLTFLELSILHLRSISTRIENKFRKFASLLLYWRRFHLFVGRHILTVNGQKVEIIIFE